MRLISLAPATASPCAPAALLGARRAHPAWSRWQARLEATSAKLHARLREAGKAPRALGVRLELADGTFRLVSLALPARAGEATMKAAALGLLRRALEPVADAEIARWELVAWQLEDAPGGPADFARYYRRRHGHAPGTARWRKPLLAWGRRLKTWAGERLG